jgi:DNA-binding response OmpR family regulator
METAPPLAVRMLVVDDDEGIARLLSVIFRRANIAVDIACDGQAGLDRLSNESYDVILLDLMLPGTNGFDVIRTLKATRSEVLARTIVLTAASDRMLRDFEDAPLVRRVIRKPFDIDDLVAAVRSCSGEGVRHGAGAESRVQ